MKRPLRELLLLLFFIIIMDIDLFRKQPPSKPSSTSRSASSSAANASTTRSDRQSDSDDSDIDESRIANLIVEEGDSDTETHQQLKPKRPKPQRTTSTDTNNNNNNNNNNDDDNNQDSDGDDDNDDDDDDDDDNHDTSTSSSITSFSDLGVHGWLVDCCRGMGLEHPTAVQRHCIPRVLAGDNVIGAAETGSGKTAAFAVPILHSLAIEPFGPFALVLTPTRCVSTCLVKHVTCEKTAAEASSSKSQQRENTVQQIGQ
jgi:ATP-dependent helicase YprA (DUF1998 family)